MKCGVTRKRVFKTHELALQRGGELLGREGCEARAFRAYKCIYCGYYHLTKK